MDFKILVDWRKNISIIMAILAFFIFAIPYVSDIATNPDLTLSDDMNYFVILLCATPTILCLLYIFYMRNRIPKASSKRIGIVFCISYADPLQYKRICEKFIRPFRKIINDAQPGKYDVIILNDYVATKAYTKFQSNKINAQKDLLLKSKCQIMIMGDCINGGDGETYFCKLNLVFGISHPAINLDVQKLLSKEMSIAFAPLQKIVIEKETETDDFEVTANILHYVLLFILATTQLYTHQIDEARESFLLIKNETIHIEHPIITKILNVIDNRIGLCYTISALTNYSHYCNDRDSKHLISARQDMHSPYVKSVKYDFSNLTAICNFVLDTDVDAALASIDRTSKNDLIGKFNKVFLKLYKDPSPTNINKAFHTYKSIDKLSMEIVTEIERFIFEAYKKDEKKYQLLFLLSMIYDHLNNSSLAKYTYEQFYLNSSHLYSSSSLTTVFEYFCKKYEDVAYKPEEVHF